MTSPTKAKVDYQGFSQDTTDFIERLKRVLADINLRLAAVENIDSRVAEFERRYGDVALNRIDVAIAPLLQEMRQGLETAKAELAELDNVYRNLGMERVHEILDPLIAGAQAALAQAEARIADLDQFLAAKQSVAEKGQPQGYAGLDAAGKVPTAQLPNVVTTSAVGAAIAGASGLSEPADGDRFGGVLTGAATVFWTTWGNIKAALQTYFDGLYATVDQGEKADGAVQRTGGTIEGGFTATATDDGTKASGTYRPTPVGGNLCRAVNGGAFTLAAPNAAGDYTLIVQITNVAGAGAITLSGFTKVTGDNFTTTSGHRFMVFVTKVNSLTHCHVTALQ